MRGFLPWNRGCRKVTERLPGVEARGANHRTGRERPFPYTRACHRSLLPGKDLGLSVCWPHPLIGRSF